MVRNAVGVLLTAHKHMIVGRYCKLFLVPEAVRSKRKCIHQRFFFTRINVPAADSLTLDVLTVKLVQKFQYATVQTVQ